MPAITIGATSRGTIPARTSAQSVDSQPRTALLVTLISGDGNFSWKADATTGETPLAIGVPIAFNGLEYSAAAYVYSVAGCVVNYTEFPPR